MRRDWNPLLLVPVGEVDEVEESAFARRVGLQADDMLVGLGAGFEEEAAWVGLVVATGEDVGLVVLGGGIVGRGMGAVKDFAIFGEMLFVVVSELIQGVVRLHFQNR